MNEMIVSEEQFNKAKTLGMCVGDDAYIYYGCHYSVKDGMYICRQYESPADFIGEK